MRTLVFSFFCVTVLIGCKSAKDRQMQNQATLSNQQTSQTPEHLKFFDDDGYPMERYDFSAIPETNCRPTLDVKALKDSGEMIERGYRRFAMWQNDKLKIQEYYYEDQTCTGNPIEIKSDPTETKDFNLNWKREIVDGKKALVETNGSGLVDFGTELCARYVGIEKDGYGYCTKFVYNKKSIKEAAKSVEQIN